MCWIAWHVSCFWEQHKLVVPRSSGQGFDQPHGMAGMHVFVNQTLHQHQLASQLLNIWQHRTGPVATLIGSWQSHVAFGIVGIIALPEGDRSTRNAHFEYIWCLQERSAGHITAVTPTIDAYSHAINVWTAGQQAHSVQLIVDLDMSHCTRNRSRER